MMMCDTDSDGDAGSADVVLCVVLMTRLTMLLMFLFPTTSG